MSDLPTPKFRIGQVVWLPGAVAQIEALPCPDCLGERAWKVTTPAGTEMTTPCQRCASNYSTIGDLPRPQRTVYVPLVSRLTIGSVRIDTARGAFGDGEPVEYMARETGVGSGGIYLESQLHETEESALASATIEAAERTEKVAAQPEQMKARRLDSLTVEAAVLKDAWHAKWDGWYAYRRLAEDIGMALEPGASNAEKIEAVQTFLDDDRKFRDLPEVGKALEVLRALCPASPEADEAFKTLMLPAPKEEPADWLAGAA